MGGAALRCGGPLRRLPARAAGSTSAFAATASPNVFTRRRLCFGSCALEADLPTLQACVTEAPWVRCSGAARLPSVQCLPEKASCPCCGLSKTSGFAPVSPPAPRLCKLVPAPPPPHPGFGSLFIGGLFFSFLHLFLTSAQHEF